MLYIPLMHEMHLSSVDLNLLVVLDALLAERNVTRAASRVGISQSAASHALARLRALTGDELLVRGRDGMVPTLRAEELALPLREALAAISRALAPPRPFDPGTASGKIIIGTSDYGELVLVPLVVARLAREAPGIELRVLGLPDDLATPLATAMVDLAIAPLDPEDKRAGMYAKKLFEEKFICVVRKGHPLATKKLTVARFAAASHALISPRGKEGGLVDDALAQLGMKRRVAVAVPHFLVAPYLVAASDLILTLADRIARVLAGPLGLVVLAPPAELGLKGFAISAVWHERTHGDATQRWVREVILEEAAAI
jgi:DNA-binding transcriptional LysR family regulator